MGQTRYNAFIGTRNLALVPSEGLRLFRLAVAESVKHGYTTITGAADGADEDAAEETLRLGGEVFLVLPRWNYKWEWRAAMCEQYPGKLGGCYYHGRHGQEVWTESVDLYHPNPGALNDAGRAMHARNYGIVAPAVAVVAIPEPPESGGTGQGIRIARALGKKLFNLSVEEGQQAFLKSLERAASVTGC